ncbi:hypothetical protein L3X38_010149 [Prunus dulcis]|uniref:Aminotransferase-like plant mobile domain-containing protein n=1 Tax=Prunus dulcis TaxID=3755 RepID=A0AAD4WGL9_PRUDU|nr:hypothetical protein L3X38_010149 [Prunus dulcis]
MLFLLYWLNRFIFLNCSSIVLLKYRHLAEALHNHTDVGLGPTLAHLFKNLHTATLENPLNLSAPGAFWMIQIWLQVYFPELRFPDVVLPEDQALALPLISTELPKCSIEEYLMFFRHYTKRSAVQCGELYPSITGVKAKRVNTGVRSLTTASPILSSAGSSLIEDPHHLPC